MRIHALIVAISATIALTAASACSSDPNADKEDQLLSLLRRDGLNPLHFNVSFGSLGPGICEDLKTKDRTVSTEIDDVADIRDSTQPTTASHPVQDSIFDAEQAKAVVTDSIDAYCPDLKHME
ncbi:hypothetical protein ACIP5Y_21410 [Nocardia sp. NPDC088792]|uniref:hypothetical protein n=1 Tax=Nocardia sp. NPDC088792 TaxID=3364332 RepID=UPI0037FF9C3D